MNMLATLGLSASEIVARRDAIGGSDANIIMGGDPTKLIKLWREKRGEAPGDDLSDILAVKMGSFTEPLNVAWFTKNTGDEVRDCGKIAQHPTIAHMRCTLDGITTDAFGFDRVFEAKHTGTRSTDAEIFERYVPQLTHNCLCAGLSGAVLSVFKGNGDWAMFEYALDADYAAALIDREAAFWECVRNGTPPAPLPPEPAPKPVGVVEYSMEGRNEWASHAAEYIDTAFAADRHDIAKKALKELVPDDASKCSGHGIIITRDKRGALRFASKKEA
ncbi:MAG: YqaJ viral recombinase family protein [Sphingomonas sp.]